jgi:hypothetical protein
MQNPANGRQFFPRQFQKENKIPHRHAAPSAPWPWINIHDSKSRPPALPTLDLMSHLIHFLTTAVDQVQLASELPPVPPLCDRLVVDVGKVTPNRAFQIGRRTK